MNKIIFYLNEEIKLDGQLLSTKTQRGLDSIQLAFQRLTRPTKAMSFALLEFYQERKAFAHLLQKSRETFTLKQQEYEYSMMVQMDRNIRLGSMLETDASAFNAYEAAIWLHSHINNAFHLPSRNNVGENDLGTMHIQNLDSNNSIISALGKKFVVYSKKDAQHKLIDYYGSPILRFINFKNLTDENYDLFLKRYLFSQEILFSVTDNLENYFDPQKAIEKALTINFLQLIQTAQLKEAYFDEPRLRDYPTDVVVNSQLSNTPHLDINDPKLSDSIKAAIAKQKSRIELTDLGHLIDVAKDFRVTHLQIVSLLREVYSLINC